MDNSIKGQDILLVKDKSDSNLYAATMDGDGKVNGAHPGSDNPDFLKIDRHGNVLENFFENFMRQMDDPTRFEFFRIPAEKFQEALEKLQEAFNNPGEPENRKLIDLHRVNPDDFLKNRQPEQGQAATQPSVSPSAYPIDETRIDWSQFERIGITRETLEKTGNLEKLLNWQKTDLLPITIKSEDLTIRTDARLALRDLPNGNMTLVIHALRKEPELDRYYFGVKFTEEDKQNLLKTGNLGRIVQAEYRKGEKTPVLVSIDRQTNELVSVNADRIRIPESIKGVALDDRQRMDLAAGKAVWIEGMTSKKGQEFSAHLQFNADRKGFEFRFDNSGQRQNQDSKQADIPKTFRKKELTEDQRSSLSEGKTVHVEGLEDKKGQRYSGYVTLNRENGKLHFMFSKDYKDALAAGNIIPDDRHKTQVAVNSEGKTNEATKELQEPLKKEQTKLDEKQEEQNAQKRKGVRV